MYSHNVCITIQSVFDLSVLIYAPLLSTSLEVQRMTTEVAHFSICGQGLVAMLGNAIPNAMKQGSTRTEKLLTTHLSTTNTHITATTTPLGCIRINVYTIPMGMSPD